MTMTLLLSLIMMAGLFLMLYSGVGLIQDKRFFTSAPLEVQNAVTDHSERFKGAHVLGWVLGALSIGMLVGAPVYACYDGIRNGYSFMQIFVRLLIMLWGLKAFDIIVFDWILLCNSGFFPHFYPEVKEVLGPHLFGYNRKEHLTHILLSVPVSLILAAICTLFQ